MKPIVLLTVILLQIASSRAAERSMLYFDKSVEIELQAGTILKLADGETTLEATGQPGAEKQWEPIERPCERVVHASVFIRQVSKLKQETQEVRLV